MLFEEKQGALRFVAAEVNMDEGHDFVRKSLGAIVVPVRRRMAWTRFFLLVILITSTLSKKSKEEKPSKDTVPDEPEFVHSKSHVGGFQKRPKNTEGTLPNIYVVGAQKGGSSSLYEMLEEHPSFCGGLHKEMHFFDHPDNYERGPEYFKSMFSDPKCNQINGTYYVEGTPVLHYPSVWQRIYDTYSTVPTIRDNLKFIVLLREPVSRDVSWYQHTTRTDINLGQKFMDVQTMNETYNGNHTFFRRGRYLEQLDAFIKVFPRRQIMVLSSSAIFINTPTVMEAIRNFIGVVKDKSFDKSFPHDDHLGRWSEEEAACLTDHVPVLDCWVRDAMGEYFESHNEALYQWLNATKTQASPYEPPFYPLFDTYKKIPCVSNARAAFNEVLRKDMSMTPPRIRCTTVPPKGTGWGG